MTQTPGHHHITAITADPQRNLDFYEGFLGQRFIKKTVNFDDPNAYHLYYGDYCGTPGTALTFFYWAGIPAAVRGVGEAAGFSYRIQPESVSYWIERAAAFGVAMDSVTTAFGEPALRFTDPDGLPLELVAVSGPTWITPWTEGPVPTEHVLQGFYSVPLTVATLASIDLVLEEGLGGQVVAEAAGVTRYSTGHPQQYFDVTVATGTPALQGAGAIHHVAVQAADDEEREALRFQVNELGVASTGLVDRQYFHSTYFMSPARILFEIATNDIGFTIDEPLESLGDTLQVPPHFAPLRDQIAATLPPLIPPRDTHA